MGTKVHCESYLPGYYSTRDPNEGSTSCNWPLGDNSIGNKEYHNSSLIGTSSNSYFAGDKDAVRQKILEHESVFKHQVSELHRLYKTQRDMMDELKRMQPPNHCVLIETYSPSVPLMSLTNSVDAWSSQVSKLPYLNVNPIVEMNSPPLGSARGNIKQADRLLAPNGCTSKDSESLEVRPSKVRKHLFDLQLSADEYIDPQKMERFNNKIFRGSSKGCKPNSLDSNTGSKFNLEYNGDTCITGTRFRKPIAVVDQNVTVQVKEPTHPTKVDSSMSSHFLQGLSNEVINNPQHRRSNWILNNPAIVNKGAGKDGVSYTNEGYNYKTNLNFIPQDVQRYHSLVSHKPLDNTLDKVRHPPTLESTHIRGDLWREKEGKVYGLQIPEKSCDLSNPVSTLTQKLSLTQTQPPLNWLSTSNTSSLSYAQQSQDLQKRLYRGGKLPSWIKDSPSNHLGNSNSNKYVNVASKRPINHSPSEMAKEANLNIFPPKSSYAEIVDVEKESEARVQKFPWLKTEALNVPNHFSIPKISNSNNFGIPIFDQSCCTKELFLLSSTSESLTKGKRVMIDIDIASDNSTEIPKVKPLIIENSSYEKPASFKALFDLNSCVNEDENMLAPFEPSKNANDCRSIINLEMLPVPESDEVHLPPDKLPQDEAVLIAAQTIITISSVTEKPVFEVPSLDPLLWFVEAVSSFDEFGNLGTGSKTLPIEIDEFEAATLNLVEMTEDEYMPEPLVIDFSNTGCSNNRNASAWNKPQRGRKKRTRKREFQRDILPGLTTLSRHEIFEDLQAWGSPGMTRRNRNRGGGHGKGRVAVADDVPELADVASPFTEGANIWGKTPRRPRRQRGTQGNCSSVHLP